MKTAYLIDSHFKDVPGMPSPRPVCDHVSDLVNQDHSLYFEQNKMHCILFFASLVSLPHNHDNVILSANQCNTNSLHSLTSDLLVLP